jgi:hypothetical protein
VLKGLFTSGEPFFRTPKLAALGLSTQLRVGTLIIGVPEEFKGPDASLWVAVLLIQAAPYACALFVSLISALPLPARWLGSAMAPVAASDAQPEQI